MTAPFISQPDYPRGGVVGILLAAGRGSRFGADKLLHPLADATPMAVASARLLRQASGQSVGVVRPDQLVLASLLQAQGLGVVQDDRAAQGMGYSLAAAVQATSQASGWVVLLADMPFVTVDTIQRVVEALQSGASIVAPLVDGRRGHPVGFSSAWLPQLVALEGDQGARELLQAHADELTHLVCHDRGALFDVDTPADITAWLSASR